ncbi:MAG: hypothetical protein WDN69_33420 [Aliidongia sp.]
MKFTQAGHVVLEVLAQAEADTAALVEFAITDTGIGIPDSARGSCFRIQPSDNSVTRRFGGTGLASLSPSG